MNYNNTANVFHLALSMKKKVAVGFGGSSSKHVYHTATLTATLWHQSQKMEGTKPTKLVFLPLLQKPSMTYKSNS